MSTPTLTASALAQRAERAPYYANADECTNYSDAKKEAQTVARFTSGKTGTISNTLHIAVPKTPDADFSRNDNDRKDSSEHNPNILTKRNMLRLQHNIIEKSFFAVLELRPNEYSRDNAKYSHYKMRIIVPVASPSRSGRSSPGWNDSFNPANVQESVQQAKIDPEKAYQQRLQEVQNQSIQLIEETLKKNSHLASHRFNLNLNRSMRSNEAVLMEEQIKRSLEEKGFVVSKINSAMTVTIPELQEKNLARAHSTEISVKDC